MFTSNMLSVSNVLKEIDKFSFASGIVMNKQKTEGIWLGKDNPRDSVSEIKWSDEPVKSLGMYFGKDKKRVEDLNWKPKLVKLERILNRWKVRNLSYYDKITIIKTVGISQMLYNASCIQVPICVIKEVNKMLFKFLWGLVKEKVRRRTTVKAMCDGGLKMSDVECQINALKIKWISRLLDVNNTGVYYTIIKDWFKPFGGLPLVLELNCKSNDVYTILNVNIPPFYKDILKAWYRLPEEKEKDEAVYNEILRGNDKVRYKGKMLYFTNWINVGIISLHDIVNGDYITELSRELECPGTFSFNSPTNGIDR